MNDHLLILLVTISVISVCSVCNCAGYQVFDSNRPKNKYIDIAFRSLCCATCCNFFRPNPYVDFQRKALAQLRGGGPERYESDPLEIPYEDPGKRKSLNAQLRDAAKDGNLTAVKALVAQGARVNAVERGSHACALTTAAFQNDRDLVRLLLNLGADCNIQDEHRMTALHYAAGWGYDEMTEILLGAGADPWIGNMVSILAFNDHHSRAHPKVDRKI